MHTQKDKMRDLTVDYFMISALNFALHWCHVGFRIEFGFSYSEFGLKFIGFGWHCRWAKIILLNSARVLTRQKSFCGFVFGTGNPILQQNKPTYYVTDDNPYRFGFNLHSYKLSWGVQPIFTGKRKVLFKK